MRQTTTREEVLSFQDEPVLELSLALPAPPWDGRGGAKIQAFYDRMGQLWLRRWKEVLFPRAARALEEARARARPFSPWKAGLRCRISWEDGEVLSLCLDAAEEDGTSRPRVLRTADTWDLRHGAPLSLPERLSCGRHWRRAVLAEVRRQVLQRSETGEHTFYIDVERRIRRHFSPERFLLTPQGVSVFYPVYALGPWAEGIPVFPLALPSRSPAASA